MSVRIGGKVICLNCGGAGYIASPLGYTGLKRPMLCQGCKGTGKQEVK